MCTMSLYNRLPVPFIWILAKSQLSSSVTDRRSSHVPSHHARRASVAPAPNRRITSWHFGCRGNAASRQVDGGRHERLQHGRRLRRPRDCRRESLQQLHLGTTAEPERLAATQRQTEADSVGSSAGRSRHSKRSDPEEIQRLLLQLVCHGDRDPQEVRARSR